MFRFITSLALVILTASVQLTSYSYVGGLKPNFTFVLLLVLFLFYKDLLRRAIVIFIAALILRFGAGLEIENMMFIIASILGALLIDKIPSWKLVNVLIAAVLGTFLINIIHFDFGTVLTETGYNLVIAALFFSIYKLWQGKYEKEQ